MDAMEGQDAMIAQLMGMGFQPEDIEEYQMTMATSSESFSMQAATEWSAYTREWHYAIAIYTHCPVWSMQ